MKKIILVSIVVAFILAGLVIADITSIAKAPLEFDTKNVITASKEPAVDYATRMLKTVSIKDINCRVNKSYCYFIIVNGTKNIKVVEFNATYMSDKEIMDWRNLKTQEYLTKWLNDKAVVTNKTNTNIGGGGAITIKK
jgi:hypothetical protein